MTGGISNVTFRDIAGGGWYCLVCERYIHPDMIHQHNDHNHKKKPANPPKGDRMTVTTTHIMTPDQSTAYRYEQYLICQERGHALRDSTMIGDHQYDTCKYCGTDYWTEHIKHENNVPLKP